jgi:hypothetical protein
MKNMQRSIQALVLASLAQAGCKPAPSSLPESCNYPQEITRQDGDGPVLMKGLVTTDPKPGIGGAVEKSMCAALCPGAATPQGMGGSSLRGCTAEPEPGCPGARWQLTCRYVGMDFGRRPEGFALPEVAACGPLEAYLSQAAQLEHASIAAFDRLARELAFHGAPASLVERARRAQADEVRHTAATQALLSRPVALADAAALPVRPLAAVALENAVEGCLRETYGAAQAQWQRGQAAWPAYREALEAIAAEEADHAALAFEVAAWAESRLTGADRARVDAARRAEVRSLRTALAVEPDDALRSVAGVPSAAAALDLHARLAEALWG